jgi:hypothetical protein
VAAVDEGVRRVTSLCFVSAMLLCTVDDPAAVAEQCAGHATTGLRLH